MATAPGVTINPSGGAFISSSDNSIDVEGGPAQGQIDLRLGGPSAAFSLSSIYAFGLSDNPIVDNVFNMPPGPLVWQGATTWGGRNDAAVVFAQQKAQVVLSSPPGYQRIQIAANLSGVDGGGNGFFSVFELNDPAWNGTFGALGGPWDLENIAFSNDATHGLGHSNTRYAQRTYDTNAQSPLIIPSAGPRVDQGMDHAIALFNSHTGTVPLVDLLSAFGATERAFMIRENGPNAQWTTHYDNECAVPSAGDGAAWVIENDTRFGRLSARASVGASQSTGSTDTKWWWSFSAWNGAVFVETFRSDPVLGSQIFIGGLQLPKVDSTTFPVSDAQAARLVWDDVLQKVKISVDGGAYVNLSAFS